MKKIVCLKAMLTLLPIIILGTFASAQETKTKKDSTPPPPSWITMMDDPDVNYYEAVKAFNEYWKNKEKPIEEGELFEAVENKEKEAELKQRKEKSKDEDPAKKYAFEYKRFLWWMKEIEPFVQSDGRILSMDERISQWKQSKELKKQQEQKLKSRKSGN